MRVTRRSSLPIALALALLALAASALPALAVSPLSVTNLAIAPVEGQVFSGPLAVVADPNGVHTASEYNGSIEWGDGSTSTATIIASGSAISIVGTHTYIQTGPTLIKVHVEDEAVSESGSAETTIDVADAPLTPSFTTPSVISGAGPTNASTALSVFQAGIGGIDNGTTAGERSGGLRHINWDAVKLDGSQPESLTISAGHTITVPVGSQQERGIELGAPIAVSGDGFATVNPSAAGLFEALSASNLAAPFDTNTILLNVVAPAAPGAAPLPAATRALGVAFLNVRLPNTTSIEYRNGSATLAKVFAPAAPTGKPSFVGALFEAPLVTSVLVTLGTARIFSFDGTNTLANFSGEGGEENMVAADDIVLAEPAPEGPTLTSTVGVPLAGALASFQDPDPNATIHYYSATIDWGDGTRSPGTIAPASSGGSAGSYTVSAGHTYSQPGTLPIAVTIIAGGGRHAHKARATLTSLALGHSSAHLTANRPATLSLTLSSATLSKLRAAAGRHEGIAVKLTLAASSTHGTATATATVASLKL
jgi:hypothetical protein